MFPAGYVGDVGFTDNIIYIAIGTQTHTKQYQIKRGVCVNVRPKGNVNRRAVCLNSNQSSDMVCHAEEGESWHRWNPFLNSSQRSVLMTLEGHSA